AWILLDPAGSAVLAQHKADVPMAPASTTKVMTLYLLHKAIRQGTLALDTRVRVSPRAVQSVGEGGSRMWLRAGQHVSIRDLQLGVAVHSGNDAATVVAEAVAGSEKNFVKRMNAHAVRLGMTRTQFRNASGLPQAGHVSTARDLARLTQAFLADFPEEYKIFKEKCFTFAGRKECTKNFLLWQDASADGVKTGHTKEAGYCLIASAKRQGTRLISVVLGSGGEQERVDQSKRLLEYGFRHYKTHRVHSADTPIDTPRVWLSNQRTVPVGVRENVVLTVPKNAATRLYTRLRVNEPLQAPVRRGDRVGTLTVALDNQVLHERPLIALKSVARGGWVAQARDRMLLFLRGFSATTRKGITRSIF
ncbi:MAG: D-alanyl-D-alanine carboxypeptidase family protein, partial [Myxococcota bacterium]